MRGHDEDYADHPTTALLVIEVSDTTLRLDRRKAGLYASAGVPEYWIVNLIDRCLEVYPRALSRSKEQEFGFRYAKESRLQGGDTVQSPVPPGESDCRERTAAVNYASLDATSSGPGDRGGLRRLCAA